MKKTAFLSILICIAMVVSMLPGWTLAASAEELMPTGITAGDGSDSNPYVVEDLPYTHEGKIGDDLYFTWTAPAAGALYLQLTEGDCSLYSMEGSSVGPEQDLANGWRVYVAAGDEIFFNLFCSSWSDTGYTMEFSFVEGEQVQYDGSYDYPYPVALPVTLELFAGTGLYYSWTAPQDGALDIMCDAEGFYASVSGASADKGSLQEVDGGYRQYVAAGDEIQFYVSNYDYDFTVEVTFEAGVQPGADGSEDFPYPIDQFPVTASGEEGQYIYYTWTATEDGAIYILSSNEEMIATVTGASAGKGSTQEVAGGYRQYVAAGDQVRIELRCWDGAYTAELTFVAGEMPGADGSSDFPFPLEVPSTLELAANSDLYYTWTAPQSGTLVVTCSAPDAWVFFERNGGWGEAVEEGNVYSLSVAEGDVVVVNVSESSWNDFESDFTVRFEFTTEGGQPGPGPGPDPEPDPELPEGVTGSGTATDPYIFTQAATLTLVNPDDDIYFQAPEGMQVAYTGGYVADAFWTEMDNPFIAGYNQTYVLTPDYGVTVTITVSEPGGEPDPGPGPNPDPDPEGSEGNPIVIGQLPYSFNQTESDVYYTWTAAEDGTLELTYSDSAWISFYVNDGYGYEEETETGCTLEVAAGDVVVINIYSMSDVFTGVLSFTPAGEVAPEKDMGLVLTAPEGAVDPTQTFTVDVAVKENMGFTSFKLRLNYDVTVLELVALEAGEGCTGTFVYNLAKGIVTYAHGAAGTMTEDGVLVRATFRVKETAAAGSYSLSASADYFFGTGNNQLEVDPAEPVKITVSDYEFPEDNAQIVIESATAQAGETVTMEVVLSNNPGIMGLQLLLDYDHSVLELIDVENGQLLTDLDHSDLTNRLQWSANAQTTENGVLCVLIFQVAEDAEVGEYAVTLTLERALNEEYQDVPVEITGAAVQVVSFVYGDVNGDGLVDLVDALMLRKYLANLDPVTGESTEVIGAGADANADGVVDVLDVMLLRKYLVERDPVTGDSTEVLGPQD